MLAQTRSPKLVVADTMNFWISGERKTLLEVIAKVDALVVNDEELPPAFRGAQPEARRASRPQMGPKRLVVKRGDASAMLFRRPRASSSAPCLPARNRDRSDGMRRQLRRRDPHGYLAREGRYDHAAWRRALMAGRDRGFLLCGRGWQCRAGEGDSRRWSRSGLKELNGLLDVGGE